MLKKTKKALYLKFVFLFFLFLPLFIPGKYLLAAGLIPCGLGDNDPCTLCHFIIGFKNLIDWGMKILITLSITAISIAGVMYVISSGSPEMTKKAKNFVTSTIIGFSIMLGAWLIINTTFWIFSAKKEGADGAFGIEGRSWNSFTCSTVSSSTGTTVAGQGGVSAEPIMEGFDCNNLNLQTASIKAQCVNNDASPELQTLIMCMQSKLGKNKMMITSISDNAGLIKCSSNYEKPPCAHERSSCHYGGVVVGGKSQAIDISTGSQGVSASSIIAAANACGAGFTKDESSSANHVHVSTASCKNN